ncbi:sperm acrosome membrane-associated protein 4-like [Cyprinus carpio]|uniref:Sperm acrosome membrane-associated protein 4-like n=1 Tax=Cyprinus carpio TaxID=7962 RepID=A0A9Q9VE66_CYPCA|nr:sperm acrosome membrane-associated protein 4-like [Cyprinus carpio]
MALQIISVVLFTVFFSEALTLKCYSCSTPVPPETCTETANCNSQSTQCSSITYNGTVVKSCSASCGILSVNVEQFLMTSRCCNSDLCNITTDLSNGMKCYTCSATNCLNTLACKGDESQCITATAELVGTNTTLKGCASKSVCDNSALLQQQMPNIRNVSCCVGHLCNNGQSLTQGALLLLVAILPLLFSF